MIILETPRLRLRHLTSDDADFILALLNDPTFHQFLGDRGIRTQKQARDYLESAYIVSYTQHGYGMFCVELKETAVPIGICGLLKREILPWPDIGFAFLPQYTSQGYAHEAAAATLEHAWKVLNLNRIFAITSAENQRSITLLHKLGLHQEGVVQLDGDTPPALLFAIDEDPSS